MKSIAVWYEPKNNSIESLNDVELHFNLWKLPLGSSQYTRFMDIGIKLDNTTNISRLKIYFPFKIQKADFTDIVDKFISKPDLVSAIFNENYKTTSVGISKNHRITDSNNEFVFNIYETSDSDVEITEQFKGTVINISCQESQEQTYFRFRISGNYLLSLSDIQKPSNAVVQSAFSKIELIDFRVNEARDLDLDLLERIDREKALKIKKAHFFFICSSNEDVLGSHKPYVSCRNLENYRWIGYVDDDKLNPNQIFLAYHWTQGGKPGDAKQDFSVLIKSKFESNNWRTIAVYILGLAVLAILFNIVSQQIINWISCK
ncbi:hypothetical protein SNE26_02200 [Mucilaginibacter sp. cycad4]|uniref:hypothetical protein n=1 Tax=Mucilaginibacter sp. cycad4 TaxID=3342096 RepID=UPI002AABA442|nr:hypothetical protein [Mucilaginibacter gossypii]WPV00576.1 hypothetical protein SNE26_02200 [Mucilaginibacter gossypii]